MSFFDDWLAIRQLAESLPVDQSRFTGCEAKQGGTTVKQASSQSETSV